mmetsp:Transcript_92582/g.247588  ORF Transcript_92582/g.247588 Transcript_92582/m.247588 type:complete len:371 (-) Transcript_92582:283-1395(-)
MSAGAANWTDYMASWAQFYSKKKKKGAAEEGGPAEAGDAPKAKAKAAPKAATTDLVTKVEGLTSAFDVVKLVQDRVEQLTATHQAVVLFQIAQLAGNKARAEVRANKSMLRLADRMKQTLRTAKTSSVLLPARVAIKGLYALAKLDMVGGERAACEGCAAACQRTPLCEVDSRSLTMFIFAMAKSGMSREHKQLLGQFVAELKPRTREVEFDNLLEAMWGVCTSMTQPAEGQRSMVRTESCEEALFNAVAERAVLHAASLEPRQLSDIVHNFAQIGLRHTQLFNVLSERILKNQHKLTADQMLKAVKAYQRFGIALREAPQGFTDTAIIAKGDFIRPSDKPPAKKFRYERPPPLAFGAEPQGGLNQGKAQ